MPTYKANLAQAIGLGVGSVIICSFSGWSKGLYIAGFGGLIVATWIAGVMYLCLALCLAEMSLGIPVVGGCFAFARVTTLNCFEPLCNY
jgi:ethanolamine permease